MITIIKTKTRAWFDADGVCVGRLVSDREDRGLLQKFLRQLRDDKRAQLSAQIGAQLDAELEQAAQQGEQTLRKLVSVDKHAATTSTSTPPAPLRRLHRPKLQ